jgi:putative Ca2+/H+ antiporter (TMEM165/GDT1 family)
MIASFWNVFNWELFLSTYTVIFLAELPDKTIFATLIMATRKHPVGVFVGVAGAFLFQSIIAVLFGSVFALLPPLFVKLVAIALFFGFAGSMWFRKDEEDEEEKKELLSKTKRASFWKSASAAFGVIFIAEWGDLTQIATAALQAKYHNPVTILVAATLALWSVTAIAVVIGHRMKNLIRPKLLRKFAALAFGLVGLVMLVEVLVH